LELILDEHASLVHTIIRFPELWQSYINTTQQTADVIFLDASDSAL
jgi:hypothetical protein